MPNLLERADELLAKAEDLVDDLIVGDDDHYGQLHVAKGCIIRARAALKEHAG